MLLQEPLEEVTGGMGNHRHLFELTLSRLLVIVPIVAGPTMKKQRRDCTVENRYILGCGHRRNGAPYGWYVGFGRVRARARAKMGRINIE